MSRTASNEGVVVQGSRASLFDDSPAPRSRRTRPFGQSLWQPGAEAAELAYHSSLGIALEGSQALVDAMAAAGLSNLLGDVEDEDENDNPKLREALSGPFSFTDEMAVKAMKENATAAAAAEASGSTAGAVASSTETPEVRYLKDKLYRRTLVLDEIRRAYLRDVVSLKHVIDDVLSDQERLAVVKEHVRHLPTADIRDVLRLHGPQDGQLRVKPCSSCGGSVDIVIEDHEELQLLRQSLTDSLRQQNVFRLEIAKNDVAMEKLKGIQEMTLKEHEEEKRFVYNELRGLRQELETAHENLDGLKQENGKIRAREEVLRQTQEASRAEAVAEAVAKVTAELELKRRHEVDAIAAICQQQQDLMLNKDSLEALLQEEIAALQRDKEALSKECVKHLAAVASTANERQELRDKLQRSKDVAEHLQNSLQKSNEKSLDLELQISLLREEEDRVRRVHASEVDNMEQAAAVLREDVREKKTALQRAKTLVTRLRTELATAKKLAEDTTNALASKESELHEAVAHVEDAQSEVAALKRFLVSKMSQKPDESPGGHLLSSTAVTPLGTAAGTPATNNRALIKPHAQLPFHSPMSTRFASSSKLPRVASAAIVAGSNSNSVMATPMSTFNDDGFFTDLGVVTLDENDEDDWCIDSPNGHNPTMVKQASESAVPQSVPSDMRSSASRVSFSQHVDGVRPQSEPSAQDLQHQQQQPQNQRLSSFSRAPSFHKAPSFHRQPTQHQILPVLSEHVLAQVPLPQTKKLTSEELDRQFEAKTNEFIQLEQAAPTALVESGSKPTTAAAVSEAARPMRRLPSRPIQESTSMKNHERIRRAPSTVSSSSEAPAASLETSAVPAEDKDESSHDDRHLASIAAEDAQIAQMYADYSEAHEVYAQAPVQYDGVDYQYEDEAGEQLEQEEELEEEYETQEEPRDEEPINESMIAEDEGTQQQRSLVPLSQPSVRPKPVPRPTVVRQVPQPRRREQPRVQRVTVPTQRHPVPTEASNYEPVDEPQVYAIEEEADDGAQDDSQYEDESGQMQENDDEHEPRHAVSNAEIKPKVSPKRRYPLMAMPSPSTMGLRSPQPRPTTEVIAEFQQPPLPHHQSHGETPAAIKKPPVTTRVIANNATGRGAQRLGVAGGGNMVRRSPHAMGGNGRDAANSPMRSSAVRLPSPRGNGGKTPQQGSTPGRGVRHEKVELIPPSSDATVEELLLRAYLLDALMPVLGENAAHRALNATADLLTGYGSMMTEALETLWTLLQMNKRSLDFCVKTRLVFDGIMRMREAVANNANKAAAQEEVGRFCAEIVPVAGSLVGTKLTPIWQTECNVSDALVTELLPKVDAASGTLMFKPYAAFFHAFADFTSASASSAQQLQSNEILAERANVQAAQAAADRMLPYLDDIVARLSELLMLVLQDWSECKTSVLEAEITKEHEKDAIRRELEKQLSAEVAEQLRLARQLELNNAELQHYNTLLEDQQKALYRADRLQQRINELLDENKHLLWTKDTLESERSKEKILQQALRRELEAALAALKDRGSERDNLQLALLAEISRAQQLETRLDEEQQRALSLEQQVQKFVMKEQQALENKVAIGVQCSAITAECCTQTDFLTPPMSLQSVLVSKNRRLRSRYPLVFPHADHNYQDMLLDTQIDPMLQRAGIDLSSSATIDRRGSSGGQDALAAAATTTANGGMRFSYSRGDFRSLAESSTTSGSSNFGVEEKRRLAKHLSDIFVQELDPSLSGNTVITDDDSVQQQSYTSVQLPALPLQLTSSDSVSRQQPEDSDSITTAELPAADIMSARDDFNSQSRLEAESSSCMVIPAIPSPSPLPPRSRQRITGSRLSTSETKLRPMTQQQQLQQLLPPSRGSTASSLKMRKSLDARNVSEAVLQPLPLEATGLPFDTTLCRKGSASVAGSTSASRRASSSQQPRDRLSYSSNSQPQQYLSASASGSRRQSSAQPESPQQQADEADPMTINSLAIAQLKKAFFARRM